MFVKSYSRLYYILLHFNTRVSYVISQRLGIFQLESFYTMFSTLFNDDYRSRVFRAYFLFFYTITCKYEYISAVCETNECNTCIRDDDVGGFLFIRIQLSWFYDDFFYSENINTTKNLHSNAFDLISKLSQFFKCVSTKIKKNIKRSKKRTTFSLLERYIFLA